MEVDLRHYRPTEVEFLLADASKAREKLGWEPKVAFRELVRIMVDADMEAVGLESMGKDKMLPDPQSSINLAWARSVGGSRC